MKEEIFKKVLLIRRVEEFIAKKYPEEIFRCPVHLAIGQEATAVGVCSALQKTDIVFSGHRSHAVYLAKGGDLRELFSELMGKSTGCSKGQGGSTHLYAPECGFMGSTSIVGGTIPLAVGTALASKIKGLNQLSSTFFGDGAMEEGVFWESMNFASLKNLPVIFCMENNNMACYTPLSLRAPSRDLKSFCQSIGVDYLSFENGHDAHKIHEECTKRFLSIRENPKPLFIDFKVFRRYEHCGHTIDDQLGYRSQNEIQDWPDQDPLLHAINTFSFDNNLIEQWEDSVNEFIIESFEKALSDPQPDLSEIGRYLYGK